MALPILMTKSIKLTIYKIQYFYLNLNTLKGFCTLSYIYIQYILHLSQSRVIAERVLETLVRVKTHKRVHMCVHVCESMYPCARGCCVGGPITRHTGYETPSRNGGR